MTKFRAHNTFEYELDVQVLTNAQVMDLQRGDIVYCAKKLLDPRGARAEKGMLGVVFEERNAYGDGGGPMVRWIGGGCCNVYGRDVGVHKCELKAKSTAS